MIVFTLIDHNLASEQIPSLMVDVLPVPNGGWPYHVHKAVSTLLALVDDVLQNPEYAPQNPGNGWELLFKSILCRNMSKDEVGDVFELFCVLFLKYRMTSYSVKLLKGACPEFSGCEETNRISQEQ